MSKLSNASKLLYVNRKPCSCHYFKVLSWLWLPQLRYRNLPIPTRIPWFSTLPTFLGKNVKKLAPEVAYLAPPKCIHQKVSRLHISAVDLLLVDVLQGINDACICMQHPAGPCLHCPTSCGWCRLSSSRQAAP